MKEHERMMRQQEKLQRQEQMRVEREMRAQQMIEVRTKNTYCIITTVHFGSKIMLKFKIANASQARRTEYWKIESVSNVLISIVLTIKAAISMVYIVDQNVEKYRNTVLTRFTCNFYSSLTGCSVVYSLVVLTGCSCLLPPPPCN